MGSGFSKMKKQARMMQEQFSQMQDNLRSTFVEGVAGSGLITVTMNGEKQLKKIAIKPECISDLEGLQDLIVAACEDAYAKLEQTQSGLSAKLPF